MRPGQSGTKELLARFGRSLLCVRYRYDDLTRERLKTVELIVRRYSREPDPAQLPAQGLTGQALGPPAQKATLERGRPRLVNPALGGGPPAPRTVAVRIGWRETDLRRRVKSVGGWWDPEARLWHLRRDHVERLSLLHRVVAAPGG